jgi:hypothetical protein
MGVSKRIFGGSSGYSLGKVSRARKKPPVVWSAMPAVDVPGSCTSVELCVIIDHKHHLPLKHIAVHQATAYARYALVVLHLLELARQQSCRSRRGCHVVRECVGMPAVALFECGREWAP